MDTNDEIFSLHSNEITEFTSTWNLDRNVSLATKSTETNVISSNTDQSTVTAIRQEFGTQTDQSTFTHAKVAVNEAQLAKWLTAIYPLVAAELQAGVTNVFEVGAGSSSSLEEPTIYAVQTVHLGADEHLANHGSKEPQGYAAWMSVVTNDAPLLVVASSPLHTSWCYHEPSAIKLFMPIWNKETGAITYNEHQTLPAIKSCIQVLTTNPFNKDQLAGGTFSGDLHVWQYDNQSNNLTELTTDVSQHGTIVDITWLQTALNQYAVLSCHEGGTLVLWKIARHVVRDKIFQIRSRNNSKETSKVTAVATISNFEFVVGTEDGKVILCSVLQARHEVDSKQIFDPIIMELEAQNYEISSLIVKNHGNQVVVVSCDISGVVFLRYMQKDIHEPCAIIKMPLSIAHKIVCTNDLRYILTPGADGALDVLAISTTTKKIVLGNCSGAGSIVRLSDNGYWAITGCYDRQFQMFKIDYN